MSAAVFSGLRVSAGFCLGLLEFAEVCGCLLGYAGVCWGLCVSAVVYSCAQESAEVCRGQLGSSEVG